MFEQPIVAFSRSEGDELFNLVGATIVVDESDPIGIHIAAQNLANDFGRVTKSDPKPLLVSKEHEVDADTGADVGILIGCIESSRLLQRLEKDGKLDFGQIRGKWESFLTAPVTDPFPGCRKALVIAGSDKRGAIFGSYTLSEQIGVSPWYFWADVPPKQHEEIYALPEPTHNGEPSVRFRGIFINDEAPALTGWARDNFGGYNSEFYKNVFELLLRLKANFMWPAMWPGYPNPGASFFTDDSENAKVANDYGIAVSTSHHEPMQRATNEWFADNPDGSWNWLTNKEKITEFFDEGVKRAKGIESYFTIGMRGEYDKGMKTDDPAAVVRDVIKTQRAVIKEIHGKEDAVPQLLALYKEIYYHFEYVGTPRSYKWINSNSLGKTWHQLQEAHRRNAKQIWVFNVGDIKPMEVPLTFAMALAWDIRSIEAENFVKFYTSLAEANFGSDLATEIADVWHRYDRLAALRRHEHIEPTTFSLLHYGEAESVADRWDSLLNSAQAIHDRAPEHQKAAVFETVLHTVKASQIFTKLQITLGRNQLYARQRRNTANKLAREVLDLFDDDYTLSEEFHSLLGGKWNHIMSQTHYGFGDTWHAPSRDMISGLCYVQRRQNSNPIVGQMGVAVEGHAGVRPGRTNEESDRTHPSRRDLVPGVTLGPMSWYGPSKRWFDIFTRGNQVIHWKASAPVAWVQLSTTEGTLDPDGDDARIWIAVDWEKVPDDFDQEVLIDIQSQEGDFEQVHLPITGTRVPETFSGGLLPDCGRTANGAVSVIDMMKIPKEHLSYTFYVFSQATSPTLQLYFNMTLDFDPEDTMAYHFQVDEESGGMWPLLEKEDRADHPEGWFHAVQDCIWLRTHNLSKSNLGPGKHTIKIQLRHSNLILEKIVVDLGGVKESYLGPPVSSYVGN
ncbi:hypothetical protein K4K49_002633 [Colletotrichum sp. SAR 10_70]|nr:hypothetical protein K4K50_005622 [Colletotrichum sp. SAR 10_71]KAI8175448.1 hypothetical protein K4K49_002633 [Colletotrichum sp. SAR 10_70]